MSRSRVTAAGVDPTKWGMKFQPDGKVHQLLKVSSVRKYTVVTKVELYNETPSLLKALLNECVK